MPETSSTLGRYGRPWDRRRRAGAAVPLVAATIQYHCVLVRDKGATRLAVKGGIQIRQDLSYQPRHGLFVVFFFFIGVAAVPGQHIVHRQDMGVVRRFLVNGGIEKGGLSSLHIGLKQLIIPIKVGIKSQVHLNQSCCFFLVEFRCWGGDTFLRFRRVLVVSEECRRCHGGWFGNPYRFKEVLVDHFGTVSLANDNDMSSSSWGHHALLLLEKQTHHGQCLNATLEAAVHYATTTGCPVTCDQFQGLLVVPKVARNKRRARRLHGGGGRRRGIERLPLVGHGENVTLIVGRSKHPYRNREAPIKTEHMTCVCVPV